VRVVLLAALVLNGTTGVLMGWIFWRRRLPAANLCRFAGDLVVQGLGPAFLS